MTWTRMTGDTASALRLQQRRGTIFVGHDMEMEQQIDDEYI